MNGVVKKLVPLAVAHQEADEYISGSYWTGSKGCAVGCTINDAINLKILPAGTEHRDHKAIAESTGTPKMLWLLADYIFEGLPADNRAAWTPRFLRAVAKGKAVEHAPFRIMARLARRLAMNAIRDDVRSACEAVAQIWDDRAAGKEPSKKALDAAWKQAYAAWKQFWLWCADVVCEEVAA